MSAPTIGLSPKLDPVADFVAEKLRDAPKLSARQLDRIAPLLRQTQTEHAAAA